MSINSMKCSRPVQLFTLHCLFSRGHATLCSVRPSVVLRLDHRLIGPSQSSIFGGHWGFPRLPPVRPCIRPCFIFPSSFTQCTCDHSKKDVHTDERWVWGGCGDNVEFGVRKSRDFMDATPRRKKNHQKRNDIRTLLHLHNNEAGRLVRYFAHLIT